MWNPFKFKPLPDPEKDYIYWDRENERPLAYLKRFTEGPRRLGSSRDVIRAIVLVLIELANKLEIK